MDRPPVLVSIVAAALIVAGAAAAPASGSACQQTAARAWLGGFALDELGTKPVPPDFYLAAEDASTGRFTVIRGGDDCEGAPASVGYYGIDVSAQRGSDHGLPASSAPGRRDLSWGGDHAVTFNHTTFPLIDDDLVEPGAERVDIVITDVNGATLGEPSRAPFYILDDDGSDRYFFVEASYEQSESYPNVVIPVFRAGPATGSSTLQYTVAPEATDPATPGDDYTGPAQGALSFAAGQRLALIELSIVNDSRGESSESVRIALSGGALEEPSSTTLTILDNEESVPPTSRFHHPRDDWRYPYNDYRIREMHVFTSDEGGSGVVRAQVALRRKTTGGRCSWWTGDGFDRGPCARKRWNRMRAFDPGEFYYYRLPALAPSIRTRIRNYTAYARAIDGAGNRQSAFVAGRNANTFEVKRP